MQNSQNQTQDRALAATALTHNNEAILRVDFKRQPAEHLLFLELHFHIAQLDHI